MKDLKPEQKERSRRKRVTVTLQVMREPVPADELRLWLMGVMDLYQELEDMARAQKGEAA